MTNSSDCHQAAITTINADEGTSYWLCSQCKQPCDEYVVMDAVTRSNIELLGKLRHTADDGNWQRVIEQELARLREEVK